MIIFITVMLTIIMIIATLLIKSFLHMEGNTFA